MTTDPVYDVDGITIYHADCADILPLIDPATVGLLLTDPPYGINVATKHKRPHKESKYLKPENRWNWKNHDHAPVHGDDRPFDPLPLLRFGRCVLWGAHNYADKLPPSPSWLIWNRKVTSRNCPDAEIAWTNLGGTIQLFDYMWDGYRRQGEIGQHLHPTQKPVALMRWILEKWTEPGDLVLDPYMGSGPIARACADLGRRYIGIEIVEEYVDTAISRLGQTALIFD